MVRLQSMENIDASPLLSLLTAKFGDRFCCSEPLRQQHAGLEGHHFPHPPDAVIFAETTEEVADVAKRCQQYRVPIIPHGAGTSLEGHLSAIHGGLSLDLGRMTEIIDVSPDNLLCTVE